MAGPQPRDLAGIQVHACHAVAEIGQTRPAYETDIAGTEYGNMHDLNSISSGLEAARGRRSARIAGRESGIGLPMIRPQLDVSDLKVPLKSRSAP